MAVKDESTSVDPDVSPEAPPEGIDAAAMKAAVAAELFGDLAKSLSVGRYEIEESLGEGGMGVVYAARDPALGRRVALKLVAHGLASEPRRRSRMVQEAQALAKLSHPNVVHVYEVGEHDDNVFVAMELVEGVSLRDWLKSDRALSELEDVFMQAGRGLSAAHQADLVHRDFKPTNVIVGADGRVRVLDFGLALGPGLRTESADTLGSSPEDGRLTRTGAVIGTPAYMAPEQIRGAPADQLADQFSFCVALFEALTGARPYRFNDLRKHPDTADIGAWKGVPVPWRAPLRRGLSTDPAKRWPSMAVLLQTLQRRRAFWRRSPWVVAGVGAVVVLALPRGADPEAEPGPCAQVPESLPGWDDAQRTRIAQAFSATGAPFADDVWISARERLETFARDWAQTRSEACGPVANPPAIACLQRAATGFEAVMTEYEAVGRGNVASIHDLASLLESPSECTQPNPTSFGSEVDQEFLAPIARAEAANRAGRPRVALEALGPLADSEALRGTDALATMFRLRAKAKLRLSETSAAFDDLASSLREARSRAARARTLAAWVDVLLDQERLQSAEDFLRALEATVASDSAPSIRAELLEMQGVIRSRTDRLDEGIALLDECLSLRQQLGDRKGILDTRMLIANALSESDDTSKRRRAKELYARQSEEIARDLGTSHPDYAAILYNIGVTLTEDEEYEDALELFLQADAIDEANLPEHSPGRARTRLKIAEALLVLDRVDEVEPYIDAAWQCIQRNPGSHSDHRAARSLLANYAVAKQDWKASLEHYKALAELFPDNLFVAQNLVNQHLNTGDPQGANRALDRVRALLPQAGFEGNMLSLLTINVALLEGRVLLTAGETRAAGRKFTAVLADLEALGVVEPKSLEIQRNRMLTVAAQRLKESSQ